MVIRSNPEATRAMKYHFLAALSFLTVSMSRGVAEELFHVEQRSPVSFERVEKLVLEAVASRSEFQALDATLSADKAAREAVTVWSDPQIGIGPIFYDTDRLTPSQFGDIGYAMRQAFPKWREKSVLLEAVDIRNQRTEIEQAIATARLRRELYQALIKKAETAETLVILADDLRWIETIVIRKEDRFKVQQAGHNELMALQNERGLQELKLQLATNRLSSIHFRLRRLLNRPLTNKLPDLQLPIPLTPIRFESAMVDMARERNPRIKWLRSAVRTAENETKKVELQRQPRWSVQAETRQYSGDGGFREGRFQIGLSIPWVNRKERQADIRSKKQLIDSARKQLAEAEAQLEEALHTLTLEMDGIDRSLRIHRDEIQLRRQEIAASAQSAWEVNRGSLDELLNQRRKLIEDRLKVVQLTARLHHLAAEIVEIVGVASPSEIPN